MFRRLIISFLAAGCLIACSSSEPWQGTVEQVDGVTVVTNPADPLWEADAGSEPRLTFNLEQVFGADTEPAAAILGEPFLLYAAADASGNVYVLDAQAKRLVSFAPDGSVRWQAGQPGGGPGEFDDPAGIAVNADGSVAVLNQDRSRLETWDTQGNYVTSLALSELPLSRADMGAPYIAGFAGDDIVLYGMQTGRTGARIVTVDLGGPAILGDFEWDQLPDIERPPGTFVFGNAGVRTEHGTILVGSRTGYQFRIYSMDGSIRRHVTRRVDYPARAGFARYERRGLTKTFGEVLAPMLMEPEFLLVAVTWVPDVEDPDEIAEHALRSSPEELAAQVTSWLSSFDLYDREGRLLYSLVEEGDDWPSTGRPQFIGPDNRLYTIAGDPFPQIRRYEVVVR